MALLYYSTLKNNTIIILWNIMEYNNKSTNIAKTYIYSMENKEN